MFFGVLNQEHSGSEMAALQSALGVLVKGVIVEDVFCDFSFSFQMGDGQGPSSNHDSLYLDWRKGQLYPDWRNNCSPPPKLKLLFLLTGIRL